MSVLMALAAAFSWQVYKQKLIQREVSFQRPAGPLVELPKVRPRECPFNASQKTLIQPQAGAVTVTSCDPATGKLGAIARYEVVTGDAVDAVKASPYGIVVSGARLHGRQENYSQSGYLLTESEYVQGKKEGTLRTYYGEPYWGVVKSEVYFRDGRPAGTVREFYINGKLKRENTFVEEDRYSVLERDWIIYDERGGRIQFPSEFTSRKSNRWSE